MHSNRMTTTNSETAIADSQSPAKLPPHSLNEWLDRCGIKDWPAVDSSQLILEPGCVIGTRSDIEDDLRQHSSEPRVHLNKIVSVSLCSIILDAAAFSKSLHRY